MPCVCEKCIENGKTLALDERGPSKAAIRKAYKIAAKRWHPDRFENNKVQRLEAEEHFKQVQIAYRELGEHSRESRTPTPFNSSDRVKSFEALFVSSGFESLVDGKRFFAASTEFPAYVHLAMSNYEDDPLIFFIDQSTLKTGGSFLAFTHNRVISKELFEHVEISYHDFAESRISIGKSRNQKNISKTIKLPCDS